jgi:hypothetical protein
MPYCPNCAAELPSEDVSSCPGCGALVGPGSDCKPLATASALEEPREVRKLAEGCLAIVLLVFGFGFLCLTLALRETAVSSAAPLVVGSVLLAVGVFGARAVTGERRELALIGGLVCLAVVFLAFALLVSAFDG